ncbi:glycosyltransferase family 2 protein [Salinibacter ruber]|uniref:Glycosyltransferase involved in cell wall biosynthesis n=1 Tax=Salinibacter ruber TaxID=146919 RepID=A0A9X2Q5A9_9BACT|nr:glycosyltransferase [Salinibacter ruber]MCS3662058.1 glycosyltransferase involved in cell wall biosynthesis [Salinibacter ruber]MCS3711887.1 glycosyltransferase involved in cell wall biosynthesis [Salinibacter ruber]
MPDVTVLVNTYNQEAFIGEALESVYAQEGLDDVGWDVIVVDDGSTDRTPDIVMDEFPEATYIRKENGGQATAFNRGLAEARGDIVAFLDGDDWWAPHKLKRVLRAFRLHRGIGAVGHGIVEVYEDEGRERPHRPADAFRLSLDSVEAARRFRDHKSFLGTSRFAARRSVLEQIVPVPEDLVVEADEYMFTLAPALSTVLVLREPLTYYRLHGGNLFQFRDASPEKKRRKQRVLAALVRTLPPALRAEDVPGPVIDTVLEPLRITVRRAELMREGGWPWETFQVERRHAQLRGIELAWTNPRRMLIQGLAAVLPPATFYRLRNWYGQL